MGNDKQTGRNETTFNLKLTGDARALDRCLENGSLLSPAMDFAALVLWENAGSGQAAPGGLLERSNLLQHAQNIPV